MSEEELKQEVTEEANEPVEDTSAENESEVKEEKTSKKDHKKKLEEKLEALEKEKAELSDRFLRKVAEFDNYRRRTDKEKLESVSLGTSKTLEAMLPVVDSLELAASTECSDEAYKKGVDMTLQLLENTLTKLGIEKIDAVGKKFDPNYHNAVMTKPAEEGQESGTVVQVFQSGYQLNGKVIRPAMVVVTE